MIRSASAALGFAGTEDFASLGTGATVGLFAFFDCVFAAAGLARFRRFFLLRRRRRFRAAIKRGPAEPLIITVEPVVVASARDGLRSKEKAMSRCFTEDPAYELNDF